MSKILTEANLQSQATVPNLLAAFDDLNDDMRQQIDDMARRRYHVLPRSVSDYLRQRFILSDLTQGENSQGQSGTIGTDGAPTPDLTRPPSSTQPASTSHSVGPAAGQHIGPSVPSAEGQRLSSIGHFPGSVAQPSAVVCTAGCVNKGVLGGQNFIAIKHPQLENVFLKLPIEVFQKVEMAPTAVPLLYDQLGNSGEQPATLSLLTTTLNEASNVMSALIRVIRGAIYIYDLISNTWKLLWGQ